MTKEARAKVNLYDSLMTVKNFKNESWSLTGAATASKKPESTCYGKGEKLS